VKQVWVVAALLLLSVSSSFALSEPQRDPPQPGLPPPPRWDSDNRATTDEPKPSSLLGTQRETTKAGEDREAAPPYACPLAVDKSYATPAAAGNTVNEIAAKECTGGMP
jgi:hypothetical protein